MNQTTWTTTSETPEPLQGRGSIPNNHGNSHRQSPDEPRTGNNMEECRNMCHLNHYIRWRSMETNKTRKKADKQNK